LRVQNWSSSAGRRDFAGESRSQNKGQIQLSSLEHFRPSIVIFNESKTEPKGGNTMAMKELISWKKNNDRLALRRREMDPFGELHQEIDQIFNGFLGDWTGRMYLLDRRVGSFMPEVDVTETDKEVRVTAELPGMEEKDLEVSLIDGALTIKGEKREEHEEEKGDYYRSERQYGAFERMISLPSEVDADKAKASFKKGVLKITLPKTKEAQSNRRVIPVES